jgi:hypothetical protein
MIHHCQELFEQYPVTTPSFEIKVLQVKTARRCGQNGGNIALEINILHFIAEIGGYLNDVHISGG